MNLRLILTVCLSMVSFTTLFAQDDSVKIRLGKDKKVKAMSVTYSDDNGKVRRINYAFSYNAKGQVSLRIYTEGEFTDTTRYQYDSMGNLVSLTRRLYNLKPGEFGFISARSATYTAPDSLNRRFAVISEKINTKYASEVTWQARYQFDKSGNIMRVVRGTLEGDTTNSSWYTVNEFGYNKNKNQTALADFNFFHDIDMDLPPVKNEITSSSSTTRERMPKVLAEKWGRQEVSVDRFSASYTYEYDKSGRPVKRTTTYGEGKSYFTVFVYE